jgi:matrixin/carboxypeptidase family protein
MKRLGFLIRTAAMIAILATPLWAYVTQKGLSSAGQIVQMKWAPNAFPLPWRMNTVTGSNITGARAQIDVVRQSFQAWASTSTASIGFSEGAATDASAKAAYDGINLVTTNVSASDWAAFGLGSSVLAFTSTSWFDTGGDGIFDVLGRPVSFPGQIMEGDILFNPAVAFSTDAIVPSDKIDFQSVLTHEIGHFLGLDHTPIVSSTMFWTLLSGLSYPRTPSTDDMAGVSTIYPNAAFTLKGTLSGTVRTTASVPVYGAVVVAVNSGGQPVASAITDPNGQYTIAGLEAGSYFLYAEPLDEPTSAGQIYTLPRIYPAQTVNTSFTTRFR